MQTPSTGSGIGSPRQVRFGDTRTSEAVLRDRLAGTSATYSDLFAARHLDAPLQEKVLQLLVGEELSAQDIIELSRKQGLTSQETSQLLRQDRQRAIREMESLVGSDLAAAIYAHGASGSYQSYANEFARLCTERGLSLSTGTAAQVGRILKTSVATNANLTRFSVAERQASLDLVATGELARILTKDQLTVAEQMLRQRQLPPPPAPASP